MYQLTYETDEDVFVRGEDGKEATNPKKERENETVIFDKFRGSQAQNELTTYPGLRMSETYIKEKSSPLKSTANATYAFVNKDKEKGDVVRKPRRKFSSLFSSHSSNNFPKKISRGIFDEGCKLCMLTSYLLLLTAGVVILFVGMHRLQDDNSVLKNRISFLEASMQIKNSDSTGENYAVVLPFDNNYSPMPNEMDLAERMSSDNKPFRPPPADSPFPQAAPSPPQFSYSGDTQPLPPHFDNPHDVASCCDSVRKSVEQLRAKVLGNTRFMSHGRKFCVNLFSSSDSRLSKMEINLAKLDGKMKNSMEAEKSIELQLLGLTTQVQTIVGGISEDLDEDLTDERTVAFSAFRATDNLITDSHGQPLENMLEIEVPASERRMTLFYDHESINNKKDMDPSTGVFTVPLSGFYTFQVSFCTEKGGDEKTTLALVGNNQSLHFFQVPLASTHSEPFVLNLETPPFPLSGKSRSHGQKESDILQHNYSVILKLQVAEKVKLQLISGSIVEMMSRNVIESQSCTKFSGYKIQ